VLVPLFITHIAALPIGGALFYWGYRTVEAKYAQLSSELAAVGKLPAIDQNAARSGLLGLINSVRKGDAEVSYEVADPTGTSQNPAPKSAVQGSGPWVAYCVEDSGREVDVRRFEVEEDAQKFANNLASKKGVQHSGVKYSLE
jgi:hypothetical protein